MRNLPEGWWRQNNVVCGERVSLVLIRGNIHVSLESSEDSPSDFTSESSGVVPAEVWLYIAEMLAEAKS